MITTWKILSAKVAASILRENKYQTQVKELKNKQQQLADKIPPAVMPGIGFWGPKKLSPEEEKQKQERERLLREQRSLQLKVDDQLGLAKWERDRQEYCRQIQKMELVQNAERAIAKLSEDVDRKSTVETVTDRFIAEYISSLIKGVDHYNYESPITEFEAIICENAKIGEGNGYSNWKRGASSGFPFELREKLGFFVKMLSEFISDDELTLWLIAYQLIMDSIIRQSAKAWLAKFPQFQKIESWSAAVNAYSSLGYKQYSEESFQFISWRYCNSDKQMSFFSFEHNLESEILKATENSAYNQFRAQLLPEEEKTKSGASITIEKIDGYSGIEFEHFVGSLFEADGYSVGYTLASNDKGVDIIARRDGVSIGIQCKCYSGTVGLSAIQEAFAGKDFYHLDKAMVVTNSKFTKAAKDLAQSTNVILWDRNILTAKISLL